MEPKDVVRELKRRMDTATEDGEIEEAYVLADFLSWYLENMHFEYNA